MQTIPHMHDFVSELPGAVREEMESLCVVRSVGKGEAVYSRGDESGELFRLLDGAIKLCNYSLDGKEIQMGEFRPGDCFGEMGLIDGLPRTSFAVAVRDSRVSVLSKPNFLKLYKKYTEIGWQLNLVQTRRIRFLYGLAEEAAGLNIHLRLARAIHRLAYSHGYRAGGEGVFIDVSHEELSKMLVVSRQSVSKELKLLEREQAIELRYGKIYIRDLAALGEKYEKAVGMEQVTPVYGGTQGE
ncbi:MAG TPA: Crp/Fnr family transcriptional regulator [Gammaproteobacteria bacterium]